jgi:hypothetical protein
VPSKDDSKPRITLDRGETRDGMKNANELPPKIQTAKPIENKT